MNLLDIKNLTLEIETNKGLVKAIDRANIQLKEGKIHGLIGESGSGKTLIAKTLVSVLDNRWKITADRLHWKGQDLLELSPDDRRRLLTEDIAIIFQHSEDSLDPTATIGDQLSEAVPDRQLSRSFLGKSGQRRERVIELLHRVGIKHHSECLSSYPGQLSDSICQRIMIAIALARNPLLLIADEPTGSLGASSQDQIVRLFLKLNQVHNMSLLLISHNIDLVSDLSDSMTVLYAGQTVESGPSKSIYTKPFHPYTKALIESNPHFNENLTPKSQLPTLEGTIPTVQHLPIGCRLGPRCPRAQKQCVKAPEALKVKSRVVSCHFPLFKEV